MSHCLLELVLCVEKVIVEGEKVADIVVGGSDMGDGTAVSVLDQCKF
jgi:hypothetical protein